MTRILMFMLLIGVEEVILDTNDTSPGLPDGYILEVSQDCGSGTESPAKVYVDSDMYFMVVATCAGEYEKEVVAGEDESTVTLNVSYNAVNSTPEDCHFITVEGSGIHMIYVEVFYGFVNNQMLSRNQKYIVTCTSTAKAVGEETDSHQLLQSPFPDPILKKHVHTFTTEETVKLVVLDIHNEKIRDSDPLPLGKKVRLFAIRVPIGGEGFFKPSDVENFPDEEEEEEEKEEEEEESASNAGPPGITALECKARDTNGETYQFLRGGCGDGIIIPRNKGFVSFWGKSRSPVFRYFKFKKARDITFTCNFIMCDVSCNGPSCVHDTGRKKRSGVTSRFEGRRVNITFGHDGRVLSTDREETHGNRRDKSDVTWKDQQKKMKSDEAAKKDQEGKGRSDESNEKDKKDKAKSDESNWKDKTKADESNKRHNSVRAKAKNSNKKDENEKSKSKKHKKSDISKSAMKDKSKKPIIRTAKFSLHYKLPKHSTGTIEHDYQNQNDQSRTMLDFGDHSNDNAKRTERVLEGHIQLVQDFPDQDDLTKLKHQNKDVHHGMENRFPWILLMSFLLSFFVVLAFCLFMQWRKMFVKKDVF